MKKTLLTWNIIFYSVQYSAALLYTGYEWGMCAERPGNYMPYDIIVFPALYLILIFIGASMLRQRDYWKVRSYCIMAFLPLGLTSLHLALTWSQGSFEVEAYPVVILISTILISLFDCVCAVITYKENKSYIGWK